MPSSAPYAVPIIASIARQLRPASVLDVGVGFGKYGYLFREYLDVWDMRSVVDYDKDRWKTLIEGVEATPRYLTPLHEYIYDKIHIGDIVDIVDTLGTYDVIIMGDVLEHFPKDVGVSLLERLYAHTSKCLLLTYPSRCAAKDDVIGNYYESHRSSWSRKDFRRFPNVAHKLLEGRTAVVAISKPPHPPPLLTPCFGVRRRKGWKGRAATLLVRSLGAERASRLATFLAGEPIVLRA